MASLAFDLDFTVDKNPFEEEFVTLAAPVFVILHGAFGVISFSYYSTLGENEKTFYFKDYFDLSPSLFW